MASLASDFIGIKSPNPFWLASAPPTDKEYNVRRAFEAGWGGVVWKTLGSEGPPVVNVNGPRYGAIWGADRRLLGLNNIELITDRPLEVNLREIKSVKRDYKDRALVISLMVPCDEISWRDILAHVEDTEADGVELNFGCPHGMAERGMGGAVGQASYKATGGFAAKEVDWLLSIGGIDLRLGQALGRDISLDGLRADYDAVFLGIGLAGVNALRAAGEEMAGVRDAVDFIAELRQTPDLATLPVGRDVVVIGGGMTAVDAAVQSKLLGAENVTIVYRRGKDRMSASGYEQDHALQAGVRIIHNAAPMRIIGNGAVQGVEFGYTTDGPTGLQVGPESFTLKADQVFKAIGQTLPGPMDGITQAGGKIVGVQAGVWAGGDCTAGGEDLTVTAVAEGRDAAMQIHAALTRL